MAHRPLISGLATAALFGLSGWGLSGCDSAPTGPVHVAESELAAEAHHQQRLAVQEMLGDHGRLLDVGFAVTAAAADLCPDKIAPGFGVNVATRSSFREEVREQAALMLHLSDTPQIVHVVPGSPGARAGLTAGDRIVAVDGQTVVPAEDAGKVLVARLRSAKVAPLTVTVERDNAHGNDGADGNEGAAAKDGAPERRDITVAPVPVCGYELFIGLSDSINAYADGKGIVVTKGMLRFASSDTDLALVMSHELAHNVLKHDRGPSVSALPGTVVDMLATFVLGLDTKGLFARGGGRNPAQDEEAEADYVGLYILARAGFAISGAPDFWRRVGASHPDSLADSLAAQHPPTPYRAVALEKTIAEIEAKRAKGLPLRPDAVRNGAGNAAGDIAPSAGPTPENESGQPAP
ncbi:MAG: M48 family metallopeptidase [Alphaproteobacteria bacterium]